MKLAVVIFLTAQLSHLAEFRTSTTISQKERIELLKQQITYEIRALRNHSNMYPDEDKDLLENYEDFNNENLPLTPIVFSNDRKNAANLVTVKMPSVKSKSDEDNTSSPPSPLRTDRKLKRKKQKLRFKKPLEIFYRRIYNKDILKQCLEWVHCQEMITPFLTGLKKNVSGVNLLTSKDPNVIRLIQLLKVNTSAYSRDDVYSILYQISNLKLRFFQWDVPSLNMLLNVIIKDRKHTFGNLKHGIGELFSKWRLDFSSTSALLKQSRIIRPPCVYISDMDGSTKSPKITKYTKPEETSATPCEDYDDCK